MSTSAVGAGKESAYKVINVQTKPDFDKLIAESGNKYILVEFYATWCGACRIIGKRLEELANEYADKLVIVKIDVDDLEELAAEYDITSMPTFIVFKNKVKLESFVGGSSEKVESTLKKFCGSPNGNENEIKIATVPPTQLVAQATDAASAKPN